MSVNTFSQGTSDISSTTSASSIFETNSRIHSLRNAIFEGKYFPFNNTSVFYHVNNSKLYTYGIAVYIVQLLQLLSFPFSPFMDSWDDADIYFFRYFSIIRSLYIEDWSYSAMIGAYAVIVLIEAFIIGLGITIFYPLQQGEENENKKSRLFLYLVRAYPAIYVPGLSIIMATSCSEICGASLNPTLIVSAVIFGILWILLGGLISLL